MPALIAAAVTESVVANRILADHGVIADGFCHLSFRSPTDPTRFSMARARGAGMIPAKDIMEFDLGGNPIDERGRRMTCRCSKSARREATRPTCRSSRACSARRSRVSSGPKRWC